MSNETRAAAHQRMLELTSLLERTGYADPRRTPPKVRGKDTIPFDRHRHSEKDLEDLEKAPEWKRLRARLFQKRGRRCQSCVGDDRLEAHHRYYFAEHKVWRYELEDLLVLCRPCHALVHGHTAKAVDIIYEDLVRGTPRERARRESERLREDELDWEVDVALGFYDDPTLLFDEDNTGDWYEEHGEDPGDMAEERMHALSGYYDEDDYDDYDDADGYDGEDD